MQQKRVGGGLLSKEAIYESFSDVPDFIYLEHEYIDKTWISRAHYHNSIEFSACISGTHRVCINGTMYTIEAGEIACINSFDVHYFDMQQIFGKTVPIIGRRTAITVGTLLCGMRGLYNAPQRNRGCSAFFPKNGTA